MFPLQQIKSRRERNRRITELNRELADTWKYCQTASNDPVLAASKIDSEPEGMPLGNADPPDPDGIDSEARALLYEDMTRDTRWKLDRIRQELLIKNVERWGLDVPSEYWDDEDGKLRGFILTKAGENWVTREAGKRHREWAKDWVAIIFPLLSAIIAILSLLVALRKR